MRKLSREYGWSALGVYFALTALDFPFCYLFVRQMGTDKIGELILLVVKQSPCFVQSLGSSKKYKMCSLSDIQLVLDLSDKTRTGGCNGSVRNLRAGREDLCG
jgi:Protein of unknown function (DUF1279)